MHDTRRCIASERVVYAGERRTGWRRDALTAAVTPHIDASALANGDADMIVMQGGDVRYSSHLLHKCMIQLPITKCHFSLSFTSSSISEWQIYRDWIASVCFVPNAQLPVAVSAPNVKLSLVSKRQGVCVTADYLD